MKVGTDGVLLGAWAPTPFTFHLSPFNFLDIGTGSGLIALMLAQRCPSAHIDAIDIDEAAVEQARENFENSAFSLQLSAFQSSLQEWQIGNEQSSMSNKIGNEQSSMSNKKYSLIVSNPPYFQNSLKNPDPGRKAARHTDSLSFEELIAHSVRLLAENGILALILPAEAEEEMRAIASAAGLQLMRVTRVYSKESKPARRVLMAFTFHLSPFTFLEDRLILEDEKGGRSAAYSKLCEEFYL